MATHDYVIDNSTGANVRADLNLVLQAILTNNSSGSAPSTTAAYMWWADTTNGVLKIRNSANNAWVELLQLDGTLTLEDGSASTPALAFRDDLDTGIYSSAANKFNVATGGVERMELGTQTVFNEDGADVDFRIEGDNEANLFYVDAGNDRVAIGTSSPAADFHVALTGTSTSVGSNFISLRSGASGRDAGIQFADGTTSAYVGMLGGAIYFADSGSSEIARFDSSGRLLLGTTTEGHASADDFTVATSASTGITIRSGSSSEGNIYFSKGTSGSDEYKGIISYNHSNNSMAFAVDAEQTITINNNHRVGIGISNQDNNHLQVVGLGSSDGTFMLGGSSNLVVGYRLNYSNSGSTSIEHKLNYHSIDANAQTKYTSGFHTFHTGTGGDECVRILADGTVGIGTTTTNRTVEIKVSSPGIRLEETSSGGSKRLELFLDGSEANIAAPQSSQQIMLSVSGADTMRLARSGSHAEVFINTASVLNNGVLCIQTNGSNGIALRTGATNSQTHQSFQSPNGVHGTITTDGSNTQYNTSSDYRLKENVTAISDGITRIKNLLPKRFNFKLKPDVTQDGFLAHEVSSVVPEAVSGDKDAVDSNGDVVSQQLDTSKLIPLLVACVQELITKVEALEAA